jgi:50S ribosome-binding GTPase
MTERAVPSRQKWLPSALRVFFGAEPDVSDPWARIRNSVSAFAAQTGAAHDLALSSALSLGAIDSESLKTASEEWTIWQDLPIDFTTPMRVVLMGRTMAGKSSLFSALSGEHFDRIGDGRQRFSRDVRTASPSASRFIELVDTPGVGAHDGAEDFALAFKAAQGADLIVWVASSDSIQEETARALRELGLIGKPIVVVLNCRQSLEGVGRLNLLKFPDRVFGHREGLVDVIRQQLATAGVEALDVVYLHALAATKARGSGVELDAELHAASRIDDLSAALEREYAAHNESRRALRVIDGQRHQAERFTFELAQGSAAFRAQADHDTQLNADLRVRVTRVVRVAEEGMNSDISIAIGRRRDWHLTVSDFGKSLQPQWEKELDDLQTELNQALANRLTNLSAEVDSTVSATNSEWAWVSHDQFALKDLTGFDSVFGNRMIRVGFAAFNVGVGLAAGFAGAQIGAALGLAGGPLAIATGIVGGLVGFGIAAAVGPLKRLATTWVLGTDEVLRRRRDELGEKLGPLLDELQITCKRSVEAQVVVLRDSLEAAFGQSDEHSAALHELGAGWAALREQLRDLIRELDTATTSALLRIAGRERLAGSVKRATRLPGVAIIAEFDNHGFSEAWLFPPDVGERLAAGAPPNVGGEAAISLSYLLGLVDAPVRLLQANEFSATLGLEDHVPVQITDTWSDALTSHLGRLIRIENSTRSSES